MNLLIFGERGQLASELKARCPKHINPIFIGRNNLDLIHLDKIHLLFKKFNPDFVINTAAYTDVDQAEQNPELATKVNSLVPKVIAHEACSFNIPYLHISTDYVFHDNGDQPLSEKTLPSPRSVYGKSKFEGEKNIMNAGGLYIILRTSWIFSKYGKNFLKTILNLSKCNEYIEVINDQIGGPTPTEEIANACYKLILEKENLKSGILHFSGFPDVSWAEFAREIINQSIYDTKVKFVSTDYYQLNNKNYIAMRPFNSRLDCNLINHLYSIKRPEWKKYIKKIVDSINLEE